LAVLFFFISGAVSAAEIVEQGRYVADGDTFDLSVPGRILKVRICGIDPESESLVQRKHGRNCRSLFMERP
jgi:endonuclease YncB( thermonuclease family)